MFNRIRRLREISTTLDVADYADLSLPGGFPELALLLSEATRTDWYESYLVSPN
jgi:hypothetical protein